MQISSVRPGALDLATAGDLAEVNAHAAASDAPHFHVETGEILRGRLVHGWDGEGADRVILAHDADGRLLGGAEVDLPAQENLDLVWFRINVDPEVRRRGIGSALLEAVVAVSTEAGRGLLMTGAWHGTTGVVFLKDHGFEQASIAAQRRLYTQELPRQSDIDLLAQARSASTAYETVRLTGPLPEDMLEPMLHTVEAINDAPLDDLELEDDNFTIDRLRRYDAAQAAQQQRIHRVIARSLLDGSPAGHSVVAVDGRRPHLGEQHDTSVLREHRGHLLGLRLKLEMLEWLRAEEPQLSEVDTWNQESNTHMIAVNDAIGCVVVGREVMFQKHV